jgi:hypothetical protein
MAGVPAVQTPPDRPARRALPAVALALALVGAARGEPPDADFDRSVRRVVAGYCLECHETDVGEGGIDLERFATVAALRAEPGTWSKVVAVLDSGEMPPQDAKPLPAPERDRLRGWVGAFLKAEARAHAGDPGPVLLRRLTNAQYTHTLRDLTGLADLDPAKEFPADGAAGEGFTSTGAALVMSPSLLGKYLDAAKGVAAHAVLLPDGLRFAPGTSPRDWSDEAVARIRAFYARFSDASEGTPVNLQGVVFATNEGGRLPLQRYLAALLDEREGIRAGRRTLDAAAAARGLSPKYLATLWGALETDRAPSLLLDPLRDAWRSAEPGAAADLARRFVPWQQALWKFNSVGHIGKVGGPKSWLEPVSPLVARHEVRLAFPARPPADGGDVRLFLAVGDAGDGDTGDTAVWEGPRIVTPGRPDLPLRDVRALARHQKARRVEVVTHAAACLDAAAEAMQADGPTDPAAVAGRLGVDPDVLAAWFRYLGLGAGPPAIPPDSLLTAPIPSAGGYAFVAGWGTPETPLVLANASDQHVRIPGNAKPRGVVMHPSPSLRVAASWRSPVAGTIRVAATVGHAHPECGNGVSWRLELRRGGTRQRLAAGTAQGVNPVAVGPFAGLAVRPGDLVSLSVGPRDGNHACDLTAVDLNITSGDRTWDLAADVSPDIAAGNPHADRQGHPAVWHFHTEPDAGASGDAVVPAGSLLARWQDARDAAERKRLAREIEALLRDGPPEAADASPDAALYRQLTALRGPLLDGLRPKAGAPAEGIGSSEVGLPPEAFGRAPDGAAIDPANLTVRAPSVVEVRLPAELVAGSEFVATGTLASPAGSVQFRAALAPPDPGPGPLPGVPIVAAPDGPAGRRIAADLDAFRALFPPALCYTKIVPVDEVVTLTLFYREDEPLRRLMLDDRQVAELDRLWDELHFVSKDALTLVDAFGQLLEYASQDGDPRVFEPLRQPILDRAAAFRKALADAEPRHLDAVLDFASLAYRRPLTESEIGDLRRLYRTLRDEALPHEEAIRLALARVLVAPAFLYRVERPGAGNEPGPVSPWELASRLSYFLWSSAPDAPLRDRAATGDLANPDVLAAELRRMLQDGRTRRLAEEFACQWLHVYDFPALDEKSERHFPTFAGLRPAMYEETIRYFTDLFQNDGSILSLIDADHTFLDEDLARHYGIAGVTGPEWRRVEGVRRHGRGGVLGLATTLAKQSGASRTSPILRGNWISEVLLGERLPRPPKNIPLLPEDEAATAGLTVRELVERHTKDPRCASCHARIDPFGFALERYDAIGRLRDRDLGDRPIDTRTRLPDGSAIDGVEGLKRYLLTTRRDAFARQFGRKLLGFALGRGVQLSDEPLLDAMMAKLEADDFRVSAALETIVRSRQFREIRGQDFASDK